MIDRVIIEPALEPIDLMEARQYAGVSDYSDACDMKLEGFIKSAREWVENELRIDLMQRTRLITGRGFDKISIKLNKKASAVNFVKYINADGVLTTLDAGFYLVDTIGGHIEPAYMGTWPQAQDVPNAVQIEYISGFEKASDIPQSIKQALLDTVRQWYNGLEGQAWQISPDRNNTMAILAQYVDMRDYYV